METDFLALMPHEITIKRPQRDASGNAIRTREGQPLYTDTPDTARCLVTGANTDVLRKSMTGEMFNANTSINLAGPVLIGPDDQVVLPDGTSPTLISEAVPYSDETGEVHNTMVHCA